MDRICGDFVRLLQKAAASVVLDRFKRRLYTRIGEYLGSTHVYF